MKWGAAGSVVEPSGAGGWWKCCLKVPLGILRKGSSNVSFVYNGEAPERAEFATVLSGHI